MFNMKLNYVLLLTILSIAVIFITGCAKQGPPTPSCPTCPNPGTWSACTEEAVKTRTNYGCSAETNYACEGYIEERACETQLTLKGDKGVLEVVVSPTLDETIKGTVKAEAVSVPEKTERVKFIFAPQGVEFGPRMDITKIIIETDKSGSDGWKAFFDTTKVGNGLYKIFVGSTYEGAPDENPWFDHAQTQVVVKN